LHAQTIKELQSEIVQLQKQVAALQHSSVQALAPFLTVDPSPENGVVGPNIVIHGANLHIVNGMSQTALTNGLGNLIIGYDESPNGVLASDRAGSHDLIIGRYQRWLSGGFSDLICGEWNVAENFNNTGYGEFIAGYNNKAYSQYSSLLGGQSNATFNNAAVVVGGSGNAAMAQFSVVVGGTSNAEYAYDAVTLGGAYNTDLANPVSNSVNQ
jgi:hypothetical protein